MSLSRRNFLQSTAATSLAFAGLAACQRQHDTGGAVRQGYLNQVEGLGGLVRDPNELFDLPEGFTYQVLSQTGDAMTDGLIVPGDPDGMACFQRADGKIVLIRNHELRANELDKSPFGPDAEGLAQIERDRVHDWASDREPHLGGTTHLVLDPGTLTVEEQFLSLVGTEVNCAGGPTPWGSWLSCEETERNAGQAAGVEHGYVFEVPAEARGLVEPVPLKAMGRFRHEAVAVDPATSIAYETEDRSNRALFYRFIPNVPERYAEGGRLQGLAVRGRPSLDTRNWQNRTVRVGEWMEVDWIDLDDVEAPNADLADRGVVAGAAQFTRGEGLWWGDGECYFACTDGGPRRLGQIWRYQPGETGGRLQLFFESDDDAVMEACDNLCVAPWGDLIVVEDGDAEQYIRGVTPQGEVYTIGRNAASGPDGDKSEICGPCFSPDGSTLFFNVQKHPGRTFAVRGPWPQPSL
ncbi:alkaline phosphatase PhoX [Maricaulis alexandrii]|uniref:alkaline phosphatase PhoX n=1 Tax=Maricaulis alexandrii TaxID=2570354 RepID=UPI001108F629|nr:alkaline phosphatase PhoX [Maricaulis alexandrii]